MNDGGPVVQVNPMGALGNRMIQYLAALALVARVPGARLAKIHLPEWGIQVPPDDEATEPSVVVRAAALDLAGLADALRSGALRRVVIETYAQRLGNFLPPASYRGLFGGPGGRGAGEGELLCNIRQGDILDGHHADYVLLPIDFYAEVIERTGLAPVFMGQLEPSPYMDALRARFPHARYVPSQGAAADFATIRASRHVVPAVSTFSWLAAWLSDAQSVHMPVVGLFHPLQARATDLLPLDDARFQFTVFPFFHAVPVAGFAAAHAAVRQLWRLMPADAVRALMARVAPARERGATLAVFDEGFYLARYPDVAASVAGGHMPSGRHHFEFCGFEEGREAVRVDAAWYCAAYPIAAVELGEGVARSAAEHWVSVGRARGYRRFG